MTRTEFVSACGENLVDVNIALENDKVREALKARNDKKVKQLLRTEF